MVNRIPITKARINLGQLAKRAHLRGEYFILEKDGIPVIGIIDADELEDYLELQDPGVKASIAAVRNEYAAGKGHPVVTLLDELRAITQPSSKQPTRRRK